MKDNPFLEQSSEDLISLDGRSYVSSESETAVGTLEERGLMQYNGFKVKMLKYGVATTIKRNNFQLFHTSKVKRLKTSTQVVKSLKSDASLLGKLFISVQMRNINLHEIFAHESSPSPLSLSADGKLYHGKQSDLLHCIIKIMHSLDDTEQLMNSDNFSEYFDAMICDSGHLIHSISPTGNVTTFEDYAETIFLATVRRFLRQCSQCDIVWDQYLVSSIKAGTRIERRTGTRHHVSASSNIPSDWNNFLRDSNNKVELFQFLSSKVQNMFLIGSKSVFATSGSEVV